MKPYVSYAIAVATILAYAAGNPESMWLQPPQSGFMPYQLLTYALCHAGGLHLALNLLALFSFGPTLERAWGHGKFLFCCLFCCVAGGLLQLTAMSEPAVGASGIMFGLFTAFVIGNPRRRVISLIPYPLQAWMVLALYIVISLAALVFHWLGGVAHLVHLGGALAGAVFAVSTRE